MYTTGRLLSASPLTYYSRPALSSPPSIAIPSYEPDFSKAIASIIWTRHRTQTTCVIFRCNVANCPLCPPSEVNPSPKHSDVRMVRNQRKFLRAKRSCRLPCCGSSGTSPEGWNRHATSTARSTSSFSVSSYPDRMSSSSSSKSSSPSSSRSPSPGNYVSVNEQCMKNLCTCATMPKKRRRIDLMC